MHLISRHSEKLEKLFQCEICTRFFLRKSILEKPKELKHPNGQSEQFECDFCGKIFRFKSRHFRNHMEAHLPRMECKICGVSIKQMSMLRHLQIVHATERNFKCQICFRKYKSIGELNTHKKLTIKNSNVEFVPKNLHSKLSLRTIKSTSMKFQTQFSVEFVTKFLKMKEL